MSKKRIPESWAEASLDDITKFSGFISDGDWVESKDQDPNGNIRLIQLADIGDGEFRNKSSRFMNVNKATKLRCTYLEEGDILVARMPDPLGRACIFPKLAQPAVTVVDTCIIRLDRKYFSPKCYMHFINTPIKRAEIVSLKSGTTRQRITKTKLSQIKFHVPPLAEQKRIVAKIESTQEKVKAIESHASKAEELTEKYRESLFKKAFSGTLKNFNSSTNFWTELNSQIIRTQKLLKKSEKHFPLVESSKVLGWWEVPSHWYKATWNHVTERITYGFTKPVKKVESGIPVITAKNVKNGDIDFENCYYISKNEFGSLSDKDKPRIGDILITKDGTIGRVAIVRSEVEFCINQSVAVVRLVSDVKLDINYLLFLLQSPEYQKIFDEHAENSTTIKHLSITDLGTSPLPIPSIAEQKLIATTLEKAMVQINLFRNAALEVQNECSNLQYSILASAFSGNLTPQNPSEGTGHELLIKIKSQQSKALETKTAKKIKAPSKKERVKK